MSTSSFHIDYDLVSGFVVVVNRPAELTAAADYVEAQLKSAQTQA